MRKYSLAGNIKYLLSLIFLSVIIFPALSNSQQVPDTSKGQKKDTTTTQKKDTTRIQVKDTTKIQGKDSLNLHATDTVKQELPDSIIFKQTVFSAEELIRGERLFNGLVYLGDKSINCAACHNTSVSDTLNWNPDALEISRKYLDKNARDLNGVLLKPLGQKMKLVHKGFQLTPKI